MFCSKCGQKLDNNVKFCSGCGGKVEKTDKVQGSYSNDSISILRNVIHKNKTILLIALIIILGIIIFRPFGNNSSAIVGKWEDEYDVITFKKDGTYISSYYFGLGNVNEYRVDKGKIIFNIALLGKEEYLFDIKDNKLYMYDIDDIKKQDPYYELERVK
ncbi:MAG: zinc-ribbon domain-containing protein [bacterium]